ncbi:TonB-dependent receptor [Nitrincola lacisaponensis]|uniref:TonB-dependent receptor n=1 Tax=Nitrincola lacisaponensis TaxID=267850 RepID=A0A063Y6E7_9GAMM|nr:TonB-dependent receptor [Nitrincola lacisaponensis]KDE39972.1 TonB-dependent receptor [Nitrincola lacisaponensis]
MRHLRLKLLAVSIASVTAAVSANDAQVRLDNLVISASGFEQKITDAPASISVVTREELEQKNFSNLAEALRDVEGVDVLGNTGKTGGLNISIRGMPSDYTLILIDGRRQGAAGNITPNGFGEMSTSFIPPVNAIERIEVIRGPMSTLYGSDAIGGVVNIITRKVGNEWTGSLTQEFTFQEENEFGDNRKTSFYTSGPLIEDRLGLTLRGSYFERDEYNLTAQGVGGQEILLNSRGQSKVEAEIYTFGGRLDLIAHENHDLWFDFDISRQTYDNGTPDNRKLSANDTPTNWRGYADELRHDRDQFSIGHTSRVGAGTWESSLMHNQTETIGRTIPGNPNNPTNTGIPGKNVADPRELESTNLIFDTKYMQAIGDRHFFTVGGQYWKAEMIDGVALNKFKQDDWSLFAENEWAVTDDLMLTLGARYNHNEFFGGHITPRAYAVYSLDQNWTVKGGVSTGYKTPNIDALYDGVNGITAQGATATVGNPGLDPEKSINGELGVYFQQDNGFSANATLFQSRIKDRFSSTTRYNCNYTGATNPINPPPADCYNLVGFDNQRNVGWTENLNKARSEGLELAARIPLAPAWNLSVNYTYTETEIEDETGQVVGELSDTPRHLANARLSWQATPQANLWLSASYRGESRRFNTLPAEGTDNRALYDALGDIKAYALLDLGGSYQLTRNLRLSGTVENLLNKDFRAYKAYECSTGTCYGSEYSHQTQSTKGAVLDGRRLWLSANLSF